MTRWERLFSLFTVLIGIFNLGGIFCNLWIHSISSPMLREHWNRNWNWNWNYCCRKNWNLKACFAFHLLPSSWDLLGSDLGSGIGIWNLGSGIGIWDGTEAFVINLWCAAVCINRIICIPIPNPILTSVLSIYPYQTCWHLKHITSTLF